MDNGTEFFTDFKQILDDKKNRNILNDTLYATIKLNCTESKWGY